MSALGSVRPWPKRGLEELGECPLCASRARRLLHVDLTDRIFKIAPGKWNLWSCSSCGAAYIDPRPNQATISRAYSAYYTHAASEAAVHTRTFVQCFRNALGNAYRNKRFGTRDRPTVLFGHLLVQLLPQIRRQVDVRYRLLPPPSGKRRRLLDVGCGNGDFLQFAKSAGWDIAGAEPDPVARAVAAAATEADIRSNLEDWSQEEGSFDYVTANHVIEHVHDPLLFLKRIFAILRPGSKLYVDTPNIDSSGHVLFREYWRDLDPPRHLVLFNRESLESTLRRAGFHDVRFYPRPEVFREIAAQSVRITRGLDPFGSVPVEIPAPPNNLTKAELSVERAEFLTVIATKRA